MREVTLGARKNHTHTHTHAPHPSPYSLELACVVELDGAAHARSTLHHPQRHFIEPRHGHVKTPARGRVADRATTVDIGAHGDEHVREDVVQVPARMCVCVCVCVCTYGTFDYDFDFVSYKWNCSHRIVMAVSQGRAHTKAPTHAQRTPGMACTGALHQGATHNAPLEWLALEPFTQGLALSDVAIRDGPARACDGRSTGEVVFMTTRSRDDQRTGELVFVYVSTRIFTPRGAAFASNGFRWIHVRED